jgi:hypothetical protein
MDPTKNPLHFGRKYANCSENVRNIELQIYLCQVKIKMAPMGYTVIKLRSLNLLFSCMFRIERKIVLEGTEKIVTFY